MAKNLQAIKNCKCLRSEVTCENNKEIECCKDCGRVKRVKDFSRERGFRYEGHLERYNLLPYQPDAWLSHSLGELEIVFYYPTNL